MKRTSLVDSRTAVNDVKFAPRHLGLQLVSMYTLLNTVCVIFYLCRHHVQLMDSWGYMRLQMLWILASGLSMYVSHCTCIGTCCTLVNTLHCWYYIHVHVHGQLGFLSAAGYTALIYYVIVLVVVITRVCKYEYLWSLTVSSTYWAVNLVLAASHGIHQGNSSTMYHQFID